MFVVPARQVGNRFLGSLKCLQIRAQATLAGGIDSLESIPGLLKRLQIRAQFENTSQPSLYPVLPWRFGRRNSSCGGLIEDGKEVVDGSDPGQSRLVQYMYLLHLYKKRQVKK